MHTFKSGQEKSGTRRLRMGRIGMTIGLPSLLLLALAPAGGWWISFPVTSSQESQGNDAGSGN